jgi:hypothetical protein
MGCEFNIQTTLVESKGSESSEGIIDKTPYTLTIL